YRLHSALSTAPDNHWSGRIALDGYRSRWDATDQIPERAVRSGAISRNGFIDPDLGGDSSRWSLNGSYAHGGWSANLYAIRYDFDLYSNFTYLLDDPIDGDQFHQFDRRNLYGFRISHDSQHQLLNRDLTITLGADSRYDDIKDVGLEKTAARALVAPVRNDQVRQRSLGTFVEAQWQATERLRLQGGLRYDAMDHDVSALNAENSGSGRDHVISPTLNLAWRLRDTLELYANWGRGFHSNDVRGVNLTIDPASGDPAQGLGLFAKSDGAEIGLRYEQGRSFNAAATLFWLDLENELVFVGDAGGTEVNGASRRYGLEVSSFWQVTEWLAANLDYTRTRGRFREDDGEGRYIPGAIDNTVSLGLFAQWNNGLGASARLRHLSEPPLTGDNSVRGDASTVANVGISYERRSMRLRLDLFNLFDSEASDIAYFYSSRLPGEPAEGVEDVHSHPLMPRTLRASLTWTY
ncbi:MAG: TonB-dependent receptor, partial [Pseudomonadales bacterium]